MQKIVWIIAFLGISLGQEWWNPIFIFQTNSAKKEATKLYKEKNYKEAATELLYMNNVWKLEEPTVTLNLGHAYFEQQDTSAIASALTYYSQAVNSENDRVRSVANLQVGVLKAKRAGSKQTNPKDRKKIYEDALENFKESLRADQYNEEARFDYELLKRLLEIEMQKQEQEQQQKDDQQQENQDEQSQDQQSDDSQNQDGQDGQENKEQDQSKEDENAQKQNQQQQTAADKLKDMNLSEESAEKILDAMRQNEAQYLQQQQRKGKKPRNTGKPDW